MKLKSVLFAMLLIGQLSVAFSGEPIISCYVAGAAGWAFGHASFKMMKCHFYECCNDLWIVNNITALNAKLDKGLHGQPLVKSVVQPHILGHLSDPQPSKPLVLAFLGPPGTGKSLVSNIIAEALYIKGMGSANVRFISATHMFPHKDMVSLYKDKLRAIIETQVNKCGRSLFIFDEIDQMQNGLMDTIKAYLDHNEDVHGVDYRRAIFIFISNDGSEELTEYLTLKLKGGFKREDITLNETEQIIAKAAFSTKSKGGLWRSDIIESQLVTAFVPFLPLEKKHVRRCIEDAMVESDLYTTREHIPEEVLQEVTEELWFDSMSISVTGCKRVLEKVQHVMFS